MSHVKFLALTTSHVMSVTLKQKTFHSVLLNGMQYGKILHPINMHNVMGLLSGQIIIYYSVYINIRTPEIMRGKKQSVNKALL